MVRKLMAFLVVVLAASSAFADTKTGNANATSFARYSFTMPADGEFNATVVWTNSNVDIVWILVCGSGSNSFIVANGLGFQDRIAHLTVGIPGGIPCTLYITTVSGATPFRLHVQDSVDISARQGTEPRDPSRPSRIELGSLWSP